MTSEFQTHLLPGYFSDISAAMETGLIGWRRLVTEGYGFPWSEEMANLQFGMEYCKQQESRMIALSKDDFVVATLVLSKSDVFEMKGAFGIHGIVVRPELKGLGIGKRLYSEAAKLQEVKLIGGNTKTPEAVLARSKGVAQSDMRTFYGYYELTPGREGPTRVHDRLIKEFLSKKEVFDHENAVILKSTDTLLPNVPNLFNYPGHLYESFKPVIESQRELGNFKTAAMPLISIRKELLL